ncbi:MAG: SLBB domain-containing protein [candidate division WOR-3 bacterium]
MIILFGLLILSIPQMQFPIEGSYLKVQVWGEVKEPGIYYVTPSTNLVEAISFAGGPTPRSDLSKVKLVRAIGEKEISFFDVSGYLSGKRKNPPILESGDLVFVPQSFSSKVWDFTKFLGVVGAVAYYFYHFTPNQK